MTEVVTPLTASNPARLQSKLTRPDSISIATDNASLSRAAAPPLRAAQQFGSEALVARASASLPVAQTLMDPALAEQPQPEQPLDEDLLYEEEETGLLAVDELRSALLVAPPPELRDAETQTPLLLDYVLGNVPG